MKIRNGARTVEVAKTWLLQHTWSQDFVRQLGANPGDAHSGWGTVPGIEHDEPDDADDVAGFQAMSAQLHE